MASGRRWTISVEVTDPMLGECTLKFWSDEQGVDAKGVLMERGIAIGRAMPDARIISADVSLCCYTCGYDSDRFEDGRLPECECE